MKAVTLLLFVALGSSSGTGCKLGDAVKSRTERSESAKGIEDTGQTDGVTSPTVCDDLKWLVGRWRCVGRQFLTPPLRPEGTQTEDFLEYFNVYYPCADDRLTLRLTGNPDDRPIAAEFLIRNVRVSPNFQETLFPMYPSGLVRIGTETLWVGSRFDLFEFRYRYLYADPDNVYHPQLVLQSKHTRLTLEKLSDEIGDIKSSSVTAPIKASSQEEILELKRKYDELLRQSKEPQRYSHPGHPVVY